MQANAEVLDLGERSHVWFLGNDQKVKDRHSVVMDLFPVGLAKVALVISGIGNAKDGVAHVKVDQHGDREQRQWYRAFGFYESTHFHDDDMRYFDVDEVRGHGKRCPARLHNLLKDLVETALDAGRAVPFSVSREVPEPPTEVLQAAIEHRMSTLPPLDLVGATAVPASAHSDVEAVMAAADGDPID